jgi:hypothetical protein
MSDKQIEILNNLQALYCNTPLIEVAFNQDLAKETDTYPIMAYLNEQVVGLNQLENTTLKDLDMVKLYHTNNSRIQHYFDLLNQIC